MNVGCHNFIQEAEALADGAEDMHYRMTIDKIQLRSSHEVLQTTYDAHPRQHHLPLVSQSRNQHSRHNWNRNFPSLTLL